jgi:hypothetical protein
VVLGGLAYHKAVVLVVQGEPPAAMVMLVVLVIATVLLVLPLVMAEVVGVQGFNLVD